MMILIKIIFLLSILPLSAIAHTGLNPDNDLSKGRVILTVATTEAGYYPFNYRENGERKGLSVDVLNYFEANSNYDFEFVTLPWPRALYLVAHGKVDLILTLFKTSKRKNIYHFIEPAYGYEVNQLFTLVDNKLEFNGQLKQLTPYSIGTIREYSYGENFDQANHLNKFTALTENNLVKLLLAGRVDAIVGNPLILNEIISKKKVEYKIRAIEPYIAVTPVHIALAKGRENSQEIEQTLGQLTQQLKASPYYKKLMNKYQITSK